jgi:RNA polymerase sigma-32 factor
MESTMCVNTSSGRAWIQKRAGAKRARYLEAGEERALLSRAKHDPRALASLVESHMRLVIGIAHRYARAGVPAEDLIGEGTLGLLEAIRRFDAASDARLSTYAKWWIRSRVRAYALANRRLVALPSTRAARIALGRLASTERALTHSLGRGPTRDELAAALGIAREELDAVTQALTARDVPVSPDDDASAIDLADPHATPEQAFADAERHAQLAKAIRRTLPALSARQRDVFEAQLADDDVLNFRELGRTLGVSRQRIAQIASEIRERVRANLPLERTVARRATQAITV